MSFRHLIFSKCNQGISVTCEIEIVLSYTEKWEHVLSPPLLYYGMHVVNKKHPSLEDETGDLLLRSSLPLPDILVLLETTEKRYKSNKSCSYFTAPVVYINFSETVVVVNTKSLSKRNSKTKKHEHNTN